MFDFSANSILQIMLPSVLIQSVTGNWPANIKIKERAIYLGSLLLLEFHLVFPLPIAYRSLSASEIFRLVCYAWI
jgi:hypothetical protein